MSMTAIKMTPNNINDFFLSMLPSFANNVCEINDLFFTFFSFLSIFFSSLLSHPEFKKLPRPSAGIE